MFIDFTHENELQEWLATTLEPICDADPATLAEYIVALTKNENSLSISKDKLVEVLVKQLNDFLHQETRPFVNTLLPALESKSYLPASAKQAEGPVPTILPTAPASNGSASRSIPVEEFSRPVSRGQKRGFQADGPDDYDDGRAPTRARMDVDDESSSYMNGQPSDGPNESGRIQTFQSNGFARRPQQPGGVKICYDFFNKGHCRRGEHCKFSHGDNPIAAPNFPFMMNGAGFPIGMMMPPNFGASMMMGQNVGGFGRTGPGFTRRNNTDRDSVMVDMTPNQTPHIILAQPQDVSSSDVIAGVESSETQDPNTGVSNGAQHPPHQPQGAGPSGSFDRRRNLAGPSKHAGVSTIVVEKIPHTSLSEAAVEEYFQRFGAVTKVLLDRRTKQALVTFSEHREASAAVRSPEAPWGNKYAKVFFHNPVYGGAAGAKVVASTAPQPPDRPTPSRPIASQVVFNAPPKTLISTTQPTPETSSSHRQRQIDEQKKLLDEASTATPERKKEIIVRLRELQKELSKPAADAPVTANSTSDSPMVAATAESDQELKSTPGAGSGPGEGGSENNVEALKARLESLRAEATSLGIDPMNPDAEPSTTAPYSSHRGIAPRGRGRGRGRARGTFFAPRGRGGVPARASMKLDLRPKKLIVKFGATDPEKIHNVKEWFSIAGQVDNISPGPSGGDLIILFKSRNGAEQALAKGTNIPGVGPVQLAWHVDGPMPSKPTAPAVSSGENAENMEDDIPDARNDVSVLPADSDPGEHVSDAYYDGGEDMAW